MKFKISILTGFVLLFFVVGFQSNCDKKGVTSSTSKVKVTPVDSSLFIKENLLGDNCNGRLRTFGRDENEMLQDHRERNTGRA